MKNKLYKYAILTLVAIPIIVAVAASWVVWHQPEIPECIA